MDLFLMDLILKGHIPTDSKILDVGCGEGRNGIYFIRQGFEYHGWDTDESKLKLLEYLAKSIKGSKVYFRVQDLRESADRDMYDVIICSRVLHFANSAEDFFRMCGNMTSMLKSGGVLYMSLDSMIDNDLGKVLESGKVEFPDGKIRFVLTIDMYNDIKKGFEEIEPLRTLVHHFERSQSFICLRKL